MTTWLFEGVFSVLLFLVLIPIFIAPFVHAVFQRYHYLAPKPTALAVAAGLYASALVAFANFPLPEASSTFCDQRSLISYWQFTPGASLSPVLDDLGSNGFIETLTGTAFLQIAFNVAFFVPLGFFVAYRSRRSLGFAAALGLAVSALIELTQGTGVWGLYPCPYRLADVDDLLANTGGAMLGWYLGTLAHRAFPFTEPSPRSDVAAPSVLRRVGAVAIDCLTLVAVVVIADILAAAIATGAGASSMIVREILWVMPFLAAAVFFIGVPLARTDRATPGQWAVLLATSRWGVAPPHSAPRWSTLIRFMVRWLPILVFGVWGLVAVAIAESATVLVRRDRRSLSSLLSKTCTCTTEQLCHTACNVDRVASEASETGHPGVAHD